MSINVFFFIYKNSNYFGPFLLPYSHFSTNILYFSTLSGMLVSFRTAVTLL